MCGKSFRFRFIKLNQVKYLKSINQKEDLICVSPGQGLEYELHVPVSGDNPLQTEPHVRVALALHGVVADLLRGLQEARERGDHRAQRGLESWAAANQLLKQGDLNLGHTRHALIVTSFVACIIVQEEDMDICLKKSFCWQSLKLLHYRTHYRTLSSAALPLHWCVLNWVKQMRGTLKSLWG